MPHLSDDQAIKDSVSAVSLVESVEEFIQVTSQVGLGALVVNASQPAFQIHDYGIDLVHSSTFSFKGCLSRLLIASCTFRRNNQADFCRMPNFRPNS